MPFKQKCDKFSCVIVMLQGHSKLLSVVDFEARVGTALHCTHMYTCI